MVQQSARGTIWSMYWADEAPSLRKKLSDRSGLHLCEVLASMDASEVRKIPCEVELVGHDSEASSLLEIKLRPGHQVACGEEVLHLLADVCLQVKQL